SVCAHIVCMAQCNVLEPPLSPRPPHPRAGEGEPARCSTGVVGSVVRRVRGVIGSLAPALIVVFVTILGPTPAGAARSAPTVGVELAPSAPSAPPDELAPSAPGASPDGL